MITIFHLLLELQRIYSNYKYQMTPFIIGSLGFVPKQTKISLNDIGFENTETKNIIKESKKDLCWDL